MSEPIEREYFAEAVAPRLGDGAEYVGEADSAAKRELYGGASALLFPVSWEEPFGLVVVEAMACGTPVVALGRGSVRELVVHGETGLVVDSPDELPSALRVVDRIERERCRAHVAEHFDLSRMVDGYVSVYRALTDRADGHAADGEPRPSRRAELRSS